MNHGTAGNLNFWSAEYWYLYLRAGTSPDTLQTLIYAVTFCLSLKGLHLHSHQVNIKAFSFREPDYVCIKDSVYFEVWDWSTRGMRWSKKGLRLIGLPGIDWPKARDLESERQLTAPVILLKDQQIDIAVYCNKEIRNCNMVSISIRLLSASCMFDLLAGPS